MYFKRYFIYTFYSIVYSPILLIVLICRASSNNSRTFDISKHVPFLYNSQFGLCNQCPSQNNIFVVNLKRNFILCFNFRVSKHFSYGIISLPRKIDTMICSFHSEIPHSFYLLFKCVRLILSEMITCLVAYQRRIKI